MGSENTSNLGRQDRLPSKVPVTISVVRKNLFALAVHELGLSVLKETTVQIGGEFMSSSVRSKSVPLGQQHPWTKILWTFFAEKGCI